MAMSYVVSLRIFRAYRPEDSDPLKYKEGMKYHPIKMNLYDAEKVYHELLAYCMIIDVDAICEQVGKDRKVLYIPKKRKVLPTEILEPLAKFNPEGCPIWKPMHM